MPTVGATLLYARTSHVGMLQVRQRLCKPLNIATNRQLRSPAHRAAYVLPPMKQRNTATFIARTNKYNATPVSIATSGQSQRQNLQLPESYTNRPRPEP